MNALCSQAFGARNAELLALYGQLTAAMLTLLCVPMALLWWHLGELLLLVGVAPHVAALARVYCRLWIVGLWPRSMFQVLSVFYQAQQIVVPTAIVNCGTVAVIVVVATSLTHGHLGLPALGFIGCPLATTLVMWLRLIGFWIYMDKYHSTTTTTTTTVITKLSPWRLTTSNETSHISTTDALTTLVTIGFPLALGNLFENAQFQTMALFSARIGDVQLGTHNSMMELLFFLTSPIYGLLDAAISLVGGHLGAGHAQRARATALLAGISIALVAVVNATAMLLLKSLVGKMFSNDESVVYSMEQIVTLAAAGYVFFSLFAYAAIVLESQTRSLPIMAAFLTGSWGVGVPTGYFLGLGEDRKWLLGVWVGLVAGYMATAFMGFYFAYWTTDWDREAARAVERSRGKADAAKLKEALL